MRPSSVRSLVFLAIFGAFSLSGLQPAMGTEYIVEPGEVWDWWPSYIPDPPRTPNDLDEVFVDPGPDPTGESSIYDRLYRHHIVTYKLRDHFELRYGGFREDFQSSTPQVEVFAKGVTEEDVAVVEAILPDSVEFTVVPVIASYFDLYLLHEMLSDRFRAGGLQIGVGMIRNRVSVDAPPDLDLSIIDMVVNEFTTETGVAGTTADLVEVRGEPHKLHLVYLVCYLSDPCAGTFEGPSVQRALSNEWAPLRRFPSQTIRF